MFTGCLFLISRIHTEYLVITFDQAENHSFEGQRLLHEVSERKR